MSESTHDLVDLMLMALDNEPPPPIEKVSANAGRRARVENGITAILAALPSLGYVKQEAEFCWSRGPRIGDEGIPVCFRPEGHSGRHEAHPDAGFGSVSWCDPRWEVPASERANYWTPEAVA